MSLNVPTQLANKSGWGPLAVVSSDGLQTTFKTEIN